MGIARALVTDPEIVFADEPTGNLDSGTSDEVMHVICDILREKGKTLIMVTHDPNMAEYADKVVNLLDGRIVDIRMQKAREQKRSPHNPLDQEKQGENQNA